MVGRLYFSDVRLSTYETIRINRKDDNSYWSRHDNILKASDDVVTDVNNNINYNDVDNNDIINYDVTNNVSIRTAIVTDTTTSNNDNYVDSNDDTSFRFHYVQCIVCQTYYEVSTYRDYHKDNVDNNSNISIRSNNDSERRAINSSTLSSQLSSPILTSSSLLLPPSPSQTYSSSSSHPLVSSSSSSPTRNKTSKWILGQCMSCNLFDNIWICLLCGHTGTINTNIHTYIQTNIHTYIHTYNLIHTCIIIFRKDVEDILLSMLMLTINYSPRITYHWN